MCNDGEPIPDDAVLDDEKLIEAIERFLGDGLQDSKIEVEADESDDSSLDDLPGRQFFERDEREQAEWERLRDLLRQTGLTSSGTNRGGLTELLRDITSGMRVDTDSSPLRFSMFHVEPLLDQAADLFDRCLRDRTDWDDAQAKWTELLLELHEYADLDEVHVREEASGFYEREYNLSQAEWLTNRSEVSETGRILAVVDQFERRWFRDDTTYSRWKELFEAPVIAAFVAGKVPWLQPRQVHPQYTKIRVREGLEKTAAELYQDSARTNTGFNLDLHRQQLALTRDQIGLQFSRAFQIKEQRKSQRDWDWNNQVFQHERTSIARKYQDIKVKAATEQGGALNYGRRMPILKRRFMEDFQDAYARLRAIQFGMHELFGLPQDLPTDVRDHEFFDDCMLWCRARIQWVIQFAREERSSVVPVSVRDLAGETAWMSCLEGDGACEFDLPISYFSDMHYVRIRGLSASVIQEEAEPMWQMVAFPPHEGLIRNAEGTATILRQKDSKGINLGRVDSKGLPRAPDVAGLTSLHNLSPICANDTKWRIEIGRSVPNVDRKTLHDVILHIHINYQ